MYIYREPSLKLTVTLFGGGGFGREFESRHHILDGHFHTHIC